MSCFAQTDMAEIISSHEDDEIVAVLIARAAREPVLFAQIMGGYRYAKIHELHARSDCVTSSLGLIADQFSW
jgi:hypothetical protein